MLQNKINDKLQYDETQFLNIIGLCETQNNVFCVFIYFSSLKAMLISSAKTKQRMISITAMVLPMP